MRKKKDLLLVVVLHHNRMVAVVAVAVVVDVAVDNYWDYERISQQRQRLPQPRMDWRVRPVADDVVVDDDYYDDGHDYCDCKCDEDDEDDVD